MFTNEEEKDGSALAIYSHQSLQRIRTQKKEVKMHDQIIKLNKSAQRTTLSKESSQTFLAKEVAKQTIHEKIT